MEVSLISTWYNVISDLRMMPFNWMLLNFMNQEKVTVYFHKSFTFISTIDENHIFQSLTPKTKKELLNEALYLCSTLSVCAKFIQMNHLLIEIDSILN